MSARVWRLAAERARARRSVILCYHGVAAITDRADDPGFYRVPPHAFEAQLELLASSGFEFVTVAGLVARCETAQEPPRGLVAITFDDGSEDVYSVVRPLLERRAIPATVYVTTGLLGKPNPFLPASAGARMLTAEELQALVEAGFEVGAHTVSHPDLALLDVGACLEEIGASRDALERLLGERVRTFAYPFCSYGEAALAAVRRLGFDAAVTCHGRGGGDRHQMQRSIVTGKDGTASFVAKLHGIYEPLFASAPGRAVRATTRSTRRRARAVIEARD